MRILYQFPSWLQNVYKEAFWRGNTAHKCVYLTFDDGPIPEVTPQVLDLLDRFNIKATFFWVGDNVRKYPEVAKEVIKRGHHIGNHTFHHISGWKTAVEQYKTEIQMTDAIIADTLQDQKPNERLFRPPYGKMKRQAYNWLIKQGYKVVLWDIVTHDYNRNYTPEQIEQIVMKYVRNGSILLFHDSIKSLHNTLNVLPTLIPRLQAEGYNFLLLPEHNLS